MNSRKGFTKAEVIVTVMCLVLLAVNLQALSGGGRQRAKREVCLANLRMLTAAWQMYAGDNGDKIVCGDAEEYGDWETSTGNYANGGIHYQEKPWTLNDWGWGLTLAQQKNKITNGALFQYVKDIEVYKCPSDIVNEARSFSMVDAMNCVVTNVGAGAILIKSCQQIIRPDERFVFLDHGGFGRNTMGGWTCYVTEDKWFDLPPISHNDGATFSFADGHSEYRKWQDKRTVDFAKSGRQAFSDPQPDNQDLDWVQIRCWGRL